MSDYGRTALSEDRTRAYDAYDPDPYPDYLVYDTFTESGDTSLFDHSPEKSPDVWSQVFGAETWTVGGGLGYVTMPPAASSNAIAGIDIGQVVGEFIVEMWIPNSGNWHTALALGKGMNNSPAGFDFVFWRTNVSAIYRNGAQQGSGGFIWHDNDWHTLKAIVTAGGVCDFYCDDNLLIHVTGQDVVTGLSTYACVIRGQDGVSTYKIRNLSITA